MQVNQPLQTVTTMDGQEKPRRATGKDVAKKREAIGNTHSGNAVGNLSGKKSAALVDVVCLL